MRFGLAYIIRLALTLVILSAAVLYYTYLVRTADEPRQRPALRTYPVVEVLELKPQEFQVELPSQGLVRPRVESQITAEVSGKIIEITPNFLDGASFQEGDVLVKLDARDFEAALTRAQAALARAETALTLAQAQTEKAREDWKRLGKGEPTDLALRIPQLREAEADRLAAQADVQEAQLNLERCQITAPYNGRVISKVVEIGQFVSPGTQLGTIYASDIFEVRLPLRGDQLAFLPSMEETPPPVKLTGERGVHEQWDAWIDRTEAAVDERTRQLFVIAAVDTSKGDGPPPPVGTFVEAEISGITLEDVFVIPRTAVRGGNSVMKVKDNNLVQFQKLDVVFSGADDVIVARSDGLVTPGTRISLTPLPWIQDGDQVTVEGEGGPPRGGKGPPREGGDGPQPLAQDGGEGEKPPRPKGPKT